MVVLELLLGCILGVLGCRWSSGAAILGSFWGSWGAAGVHFVGLGVPLKAFGAQSSRKKGCVDHFGDRGRPVGAKVQGGWRGVQGMGAG